MERNNTPTTHTNFSAQTLVQKLNSGYNHCKLYKCPVAWGIVCLNSDASNHHRQSRPLSFSLGGQDNDTCNSIVPL